MKAVDIQWDIDIDEALDKLDEMNYRSASEALGLPCETYANMTTEERHDYARDVFHHSPATLCEFMDLPDNVEIPAELTDDEDIANWLSDTYGFCHFGFDLK